MENPFRFLKNSTSNLLLPALASLGIAVGLILAVLSQYWFADVDFAVGVPHIETPHEIVQRHLKQGEQLRAAGQDAHLQSLREFFQVARQRSRAYAEDCLSWDSKWRLAQDYLTGGHEQSLYLRQRFDVRLFTRNDLEDLVGQIIARYLQHLDDIEALLLVKLEQDLANLPNSEFTWNIDRDQLHAVLEVALKQSLTDAEADFRGMVGRELVSFVVGEIMAAAATHLATSAGILGTGAASGWATFGTGIVVGLIVDSVVTQIYNATFDPVGELTRKLNQQLTQMEKLIIEGTPQSPGLRGSLQQFAARRGSALRQALEAAVLTTVSP